jgi:hypothetical protein
MKKSNNSQSTFWRISNQLRLMLWGFPVYKVKTKDLGLGFGDLNSSW